MHVVLAIAFAQLVSSSAATPAASAPAVVATPAPRPPLGPDRPGARFGSNPYVDLMDPRQAALEHGHRELDAWQTEKAIKIYRKVVKKHPMFADGHFWLGVAAGVAGDFALSCAELRRYLQLEPQGYYVGAVKTRTAGCPPPPPEPDWGLPSPTPPTSTSP